VAAPASRGRGPPPRPRATHTTALAAVPADKQYRVSRSRARPGATLIRDARGREASDASARGGAVGRAERDAVEDVLLARDHGPQVAPGPAHLGPHARD